MATDGNPSSLLDALCDLIASKVSVRLADSGHQTPNTRKRLLTVEQAAEYLGRTKEAVQHLIAAGKLPIVKADRRVFLDIKDLDQWIEQSKLQ